jgi:hypothetical protein
VFCICTIEIVIFLFFFIFLYFFSSFIFFLSLFYFFMISWLFSFASHLLGSFTGISNKPIGICEKVWLHYNGSSTTFGQPWHFVLRDILLWDQSVAAAVARIQNASRTCSIFVGRLPL